MSISTLTLHSVIILTSNIVILVLILVITY